MDSFSLFRHFSRNVPPGFREILAWILGKTEKMRLNFFVFQCMMTLVGPSEYVFPSLSYFLEKQGGQTE